MTTPIVPPIVSDKPKRKKRKSDRDLKLSRKLARMKRDGTIKVEDGRWSASTIAICATCDGKGWVAK